MTAFRAPIGRYWRTRLERRWTKKMPPERMDELWRETGDPYAAPRVLDRLLLPEFVRLGSRTVGDLAASHVAQDFSISRAAVFAWMEAARRRRLIARCTETLDAHDQPVPQGEWEITPAGMAAHQKARWQALLTSAWKVLRVVVPVAAAAFTLARFLLGEDVFPETGVLDDVQLANVWDWEIVGPPLAGAIGGAIGALLAMPLTLAGRKRHWVLNASRVLAEQEPPTNSGIEQDKGPALAIH